MSNQEREYEIRGVSWRWYERLVLYCVGIGMGGFLFCFILAGELTPSSRPTFPRPELGYTYLLKVKHSGVNVYVTFFEYLASTYGFWATLGFAIFSGIWGYPLGLSEKSRNYPGQILVACAASLAFIYLIWHEGFLQ
jgi:hypothetical protein